MVRGSKEDLPLAEDYGEGFRSHQVEWGGMIVEISSFQVSTLRLSSRGCPAICASRRTGDMSSWAGCG
jgi:hypothetical protein